MGDESVLVYLEGFLARGGFEGVGFTLGETCVTFGRTVSYLANAFASTGWITQSLNSPLICVIRYIFSPVSRFMPILTLVKHPRIVSSKFG